MKTCQFSKEIRTMKNTKISKEPTKADSNEKSNLTLMDIVKKVNKELKDGEPYNVSEDSYSGYTGYKPQYLIDMMNKHLFGKWGFNEISNELISIDDKGNPKLAVAQVEVWLEGVNFKPRAYGQSRVTKGDCGDGMKGAQTDAIKKALSYFSIGNRAFHGLLKK